MSNASPVGPDLRDSRLRSLYEYWERKRGSRPMPSRADLDPLEMGPWLGNLLMIDVGEDGSYVYRLYGTKFVESFGVDMTGRPLDELPAEQRERVRADYETVRASRQPRGRLYTAAFEVPQLGRSAVPPGGRDQQVVTWERLVLPLSDGGERVAILLVGAYPLPDLRPST
jgi:hypothetical protein